MLTISSLPQAYLKALFASRSETALAFHSLPLVVASGLEIVGLGLDGVDFVIFFASVTLMSDDDPAFAQMMANGFNQGRLPPASARFVKFARRDASDDKTMFRPETWRLYNRHSLRRFQQALQAALLGHATSFLLVPEYLFAPTTAKLDRLYQRMSRPFATGELGVTLALKYCPDGETGGFYSYERK